MYKVMPTVPMTDVRNSLSSLVADLGQSPVVLTHNGREAAVLVHPETWNQLVDGYEKWAKAQATDDPRFLTWAQFEQQAREAGFSMQVVQDAIQEGIKKFSQMQSDPSRVVSSSEMRKRMAERGVHVGG